jgi:hypothetical protein
LAGKLVLYFEGQGSCLIRAPRRQQARMDQDERTLTMNEGPAAQPPQQVLTIGRLEDRPQRIAWPLHPGSYRHRKKMKVVIAQHGRHPITETGCPPQHIQRTGTSIHQIADQPDSIRAGIETKTLEETSQGQEATLDVADYVGSHEAGSILTVFLWSQT